MPSPETSAPSESLRDKVGRRLARAVVTRRIPLPLERAAVSFTFDDIAASAAGTGARILEERGVRGTFYVCGGLAGTVSELYPLAGLAAVADLARRGHEIGCHTATHPSAAQAGVGAYLRDVAANARILEPVVGRLSTFAYPYGAIGLAHKLRLQARFRACRGIHGGPIAGAADRGRLEAVALEDASVSEAGIDAWLDAAVARRAWLVFYAHDVAARPTRFGLSPQRLAYAVDAALARGCRIETVRGLLDLAAGAPPTNGAS
ncbi:polysaccharide deacetylase (plasmid) [Methylobacterium currus]|uniref:Chitooligosaccharide deacetylase n=1 Tax=Methylobacterium currus TaxID=2051553 RepID=A0A2R4WWZ2_9HYPH|nr:polysaccharide deacetylase family protein [Methylobacterium currus]AWB26062.1 polysaccharide deacetylase [Methylobacterium currus]